MEGLEPINSCFSPPKTQKSTFSLFPKKSIFSTFSDFSAGGIDDEDEEQQDLHHLSRNNSARPITVTRDPPKSFRFDRMSGVRSPGLLSSVNDLNMKFSGTSSTTFSKGFNFSPIGVFFKANTLTYRKHKKYSLGSGPKQTTRLFYHFLTVKGCKLLVSYHLKPIMKNTFIDPFQEIIKLKKRVGRAQDAGSKGKKTLGNANTDKNDSPGDGGLLFTEQESCKVRKVFTLGVKVQKPEFNLYDYQNKCQILFASNKECFITMSSEYMQYDMFMQDPRKTIKLSFSELQMLTIPPLINTKNQIYWLDDAVDKPFETDTQEDREQDSNIFEHRDDVQDVSFKNDDFLESGSVYDDFLDRDDDELLQAELSYKEARLSQQSRSMAEDRKQSLGTDSSEELELNLDARAMAGGFNSSPPGNGDAQNSQNWGQDSKNSRSGIPGQSPKKEQSSPGHNENVHKFIRHGIMNRIIECKKATFRYIYCSKQQCVIDFSKPITAHNVDDNETRRYVWNGKLRTNRIIANIGSFVSMMSSQDFEMFFMMNEFIVNLFKPPTNEKTSAVKKENLDEKHRRMLKELKESGTDELVKHIQSKIREKDNSGQKLKSIIAKKTSFEFFAERLQMSMTEGEKEFLKLNVNKCQAKQVTSSDGQNDLLFLIKEIEIDNPMIKSGSKTKVLKRLSNDPRFSANSQAILVTQSFYTVDGINKLNKWKVVSNYEIMITPMRVNITKEIYSKLRNYIFARESQRVENKINEDIDSLKLYIQNPELYFKLREMNLKKHKELYKEEKKKMGDQKKKESVIQVPPTYYKRIRLGDLKLVVTFKSTSMFLNCERMMLYFSSFDKFGKLYTRKHLFDRLTRFFVKSAVKSILKNKVLRIKAKKDEDDLVDDEMSREELERKKKMLLGYK